MGYIFQVVTAPMSTINAMAVEAYKKYILVSLIHNGQVCLIYLEIAPFLFPNTSHPKPYLCCQKTNLLFL